MNEQKIMSLSTKILIGLGLGVALGIILNLFFFDNAAVHTYLIAGVFELVRTLFINSLMMTMVPLVFVSIVCGTSSLSDPEKLGTLAWKSISLFLLTTAIAITLGLIFAYIAQPGAGGNFERIAADNTIREAPTLFTTLAALVPSNPVQAMAEGNMLQIIIFSILFGLSISFCGNKGKLVGDFFQQLNEVILKLVTILMGIAPYAVFCIMAKVIGELGLEKILPLAKYFLLVIFVLLLHGLVVYPILLKLLARLNPLIFLKKMRPAMLFAFGTASSNATLPINMEISTKRLGVGSTTASLVLPMGATINMDGTAIMQGVATVFFAQLYGIDLTMTDYVVVILIATMASIGTAGVPGAGLIMLAMVLTQVNLPTEGIVILMGIDRILDMTRTVVNVTGDALVSTIVAKSENDFSEEIYNDPSAGLEFERK